MADYQYPPDFIGDGRGKVNPTHQPMGAKSIAVTRATARLLVDGLFASGRSTHSTLGGTVWVTQLALHYNMRGYTMQYAPGLGFTFEMEK